MRNHESINTKSPQRVLVTGGGGFLGSAIVKRLVKRGDRVMSFSRRFYSALAEIGVEQIRGDISDVAAVEQACRKADLVFHVAAKPGSLLFVIVIVIVIVIYCCTQCHT